MKSAVKILNERDLDVKYTYSEFYTVHICPKCNHILDEEKARYGSKCCYLCGHRTGYLFDCRHVSVRDRFFNGKKIDTICLI